MDKKIIVEKVNSFTNRQDIRTILKKTEGNGLTQFHDLIRAADQCVSTDEFLLYIAYKGAKANRNDWWNELANPLIKFIEGDLAGPSPEELRQAMGYLMWSANAIAKGVRTNV